MKSEGWAPPENVLVDESEGWADSKKCQICLVQMTKNLTHSFYYMLYQPKGCPPLGTTSLRQAVDFSEIICKDLFLFDFHTDQDNLVSCLILIY